MVLLVLSKMAVLAMEAASLTGNLFWVVILGMNLFVKFVNMMRKECEIRKNLLMRFSAENFALDSLLIVFL